MGEQRYNCIDAIIIRCANSWNSLTRFDQLRRNGGGTCYVGMVCRNNSKSMKISYIA